MTIDDYISKPLPIERYLKWLIPDSSTIIEIGAAQAEDTLKYARLFPRSKIFAFEPLTSNLKYAQANLRRHSVNNVELMHLAISDHVGISDFYVSSLVDEVPENSISDGKRSSSLLKPDKHLEYYSGIQFLTTEVVSTTTLDHFCVAEQVTHINFLHIDVQGAELLVLTGAEKSILSTDLIWLEVSNVTLYQDQPVAQNIDAFMQKNNFVLIINKVGELYGDRLYSNASFYSNNKAICYFIKLLENLKNVFS